MSKSYYIIISFLFFSSCIHVADNSTEVTEKECNDIIFETDSVIEEIIPVTIELSSIERVALIYTAEIGVKELTGKNDGVRVEEYLAAANRKKGDAWCAAFVTWVLKEAGIVAVISGWSPDWFPVKNTIYTRGAKTNQTPNKADVLGIYYSEFKRIAHVGFIDEWGIGNFCMTVEGNTNDTGDREGHGVYKKRRLKSQIYKVSRWVI